MQSAEDAVAGLSGWAVKHRTRCGCWSALDVAGTAVLLALVAESLGDLRPRLRPTVAADDVSQGQQRIDMAARPMHVTAFEVRFHHQLVAALHSPAYAPKSSSSSAATMSVIPPSKRVNILMRIVVDPK